MPPSGLRAQGCRIGLGLHHSLLKASITSTPEVEARAGPTPDVRSPEGGILVASGVNPWRGGGGKKVARQTQRGRAGGA